MSLPCGAYLGAKGNVKITLIRTSIVVVVVIALKSDDTVHLMDVIPFQLKTKQTARQRWY